MLRGNRCCIIAELFIAGNGRPRQNYPILGVEHVPGRHFGHNWFSSLAHCESERGYGYEKRAN